jgi:hypothetical protein
MKKCFSLIKAVILTFILTAVLLVFSCVSISNPKKSNAFSEATYKTGFPESNTSEALENVMLSVKKVKNYSSYRTYIFDDKSKVTINELNSEGLLSRTAAGIVTNKATMGTATVLYANGRNIALLTCDHAIKAPDTIIQWAEYSDLGNNRYIHSISIKIKQQLFVSDFPHNSKFVVLASDTKNDIAIIGTTYSEPVNNNIALMDPCGNASDLKWGSFIYILGFPTGQQMVAHGIVSTLPEKEGSFLTDAPFNEGFSGGIAMAVTEKDGNLELVGMARSVAASYGYVLKPEKENHEYIYDPDIPYDGEIFVHQKKDINYGVTTVVSINQIRQLYMDNRTQLLKNGFDLDKFFRYNSKSEKMSNDQ